MVGNPVLVLIVTGAVGTNRLIVVDVVETRDQRGEYELAIPGAALQIVRLTASLSMLHQRLAGRESGATLMPFETRAAELTALMDERHVESVLFSVFSVVQFFALGG